MLKPVIDALGKLIGLHQQLYELAEEKKQHLIHRNIDQLSALLDKEAQLIRQIGQVEAQRRCCIENYFKQLGVDQDEQTLTTLLNTIPEPENRQIVQEKAAELESWIIRLKEINELNKQLIQDSLQFLDYSFRMLAGVNHNTNYTESVSKKPLPNGRSFFDTKV